MGTIYGYCRPDNSRTANSQTANSWTGHLVDWSTRGLDKSQTEQLADATGDFACLVFVSWCRHRNKYDCYIKH